jgi:uncharacterized membrane protein YfcA
MHIYLPIAEMSVNALTILLLGGVTGVLSGMFGIGGGFLMTPFLIFLGIPPSVAVATSANQIIAASFSGFMAHWRKGNVDFKMGAVLLVGGLIGSSFGVVLFSFLKRLGQIDLVISLAYVVFLGTIGGMMAWESFRTIYRTGQAAPSKKPGRWRIWCDRLPLRWHFPHSGLDVSVILPLIVGLLVGVMVSLMGVGGGFIMIPAMIYLLGMPTSVVIGTSLFQIIFTTSHVTIMHAVSSQSVDIILAFLLLTGSVVGAQYGTRFGGRLPAEQLRAAMASMVLLVALKLAVDLVIPPDELYSVSVWEQS